MVETDFIRSPVAFEMMRSHHRDNLHHLIESAWHGRRTIGDNRPSTLFRTGLIQWDTQQLPRGHQLPPSGMVN